MILVYAINCPETDKIRRRFCQAIARALNPKSTSILKIVPFYLTNFLSKLDVRNLFPSLVDFSTFVEDEIIILNCKHLNDKQLASKLINSPMVLEVEKDSNVIRIVPNVIPSIEPDANLIINEEECLLDDIKLPYSKANDESNVAMAPPPMKRSYLDDRIQEWNRKLKNILIRIRIKLKSLSPSDKLQRVLEREFIQSGLSRNSTITNNYIEMSCPILIQLRSIKEVLENYLSINEVK